LAKVDKLKRELTLKDETFAIATNSFKQDDAQSYLVGFEAVVEQATTLHPSLDFTKLHPFLNFTYSKLGKTNKIFKYIYIYIYIYIYKFFVQ